MSPILCAFHSNIDTSVHMLEGMEPTSQAHTGDRTNTLHQGMFVPSKTAKNFPKPHLLYILSINYLININTILRRFPPSTQVLQYPTSTQSMLLLLRIVQFPPALARSIPLDSTSLLRRDQCDSSLTPIPCRIQREGGRSPASDTVPEGRSVERRLCGVLGACRRLSGPNGPAAFFCQNVRDLLVDQSRETTPCVRVGRNAARDVR